MIRVLVVDDSALVRKVLSSELARYPDIEVIGTAVDPYSARDKIVRMNPDVITLDLEMPRMDGLSFLAKLMRYRPMPVVVVSSLTPERNETALKALELGAVEVLSKPSPHSTNEGTCNEIVRAIRIAASIKFSSVPQFSLAYPELAERKPEPALNFITTHKVLAIGASTGGTVAIESVLARLPANSPGTVIVQHMPKGFTASFAARLDSMCEMEVQEARDMDFVVSGRALIAPGNKHMILQRSGGNYIVRIKDGPPVHHQRPAVDVLFETVAQHAGRNSVGVVLTGMGADGAKGLLDIRNSGGYTIAQDEKSCLVFGMPKEAIKLGAAQEITSLASIPRAILKAFAEQLAAGPEFPSAKSDLAEKDENNNA